MAEEFFISNHDKPVLDASHGPTRCLALLRNPGISDGEARDCARFLAGRASDVAELRLWLEMLGLIPYASAVHRPRIAVASRLEYVRP